MSLLTSLSDRERLQWKLALLSHRPSDQPGRHMATFALGAMQERALGGDLTMHPHWEEAVLAWRSRGIRPPTFLVLHDAVSDLVRLGYQIPVAPPITPAVGPAQSSQPQSSQSRPSPARRVPRRYRTWAGRPGPGPYALEPDEWAGAGDWVASACARSSWMSWKRVKRARMALTLVGE